MKIGIVVPWDSPFIYTSNAFNMMNWERPKGCELNFIIGKGWCPAAKHNDGVRKAQDWGADFILFNGGDHLCPKDIIPRMLKRIDEGWDMVQATIPLRGSGNYIPIPFTGISYKVVGNIPYIDDHANIPRSAVEILTDMQEPQESHICGTGNVLMKADIFDKLSKPYFKEYLQNDDYYKRYPIQDTRFIYECTKKAGARLIFDTDIRLVHLDVFGIDDTYKDRFKDKAAKSWTPSKDIEEYL